METTARCMELLDFSRCWAEWRSGLKEAIDKSRGYYEDETVQQMLTRMDEFFERRVCAASVEEGLIEAMWETATEEERRTIARLFLRIADRI